jgi:hypothetical protein
MTLDAASGLGLDRPSHSRDIRRFSHEAMATVYEIYAVTPTSDTLHRPRRRLSTWWTGSSAS